MEQVLSRKETIGKKEEEIEWLQLLKANVNGLKHGMSSLTYGSYSPKRHSKGTLRQSQRLSGGEGSRHSDKEASDMDNCSEYGDKHSDIGSQQSMDDFRHHRIFPQSKLAGGDAGQNLTEDIELLGFGDVDFDKRLSDISDGGLSKGTETDGSISSLVEFTLFPEAARPA